jgi:Protein of unknown function (DUF3306)
MSDPENRAENFLHRWSRRKQTAATRPREESESLESATTKTRSSPDTAVPAEPDRPAFGPATLPPIDTITATSDIRAFLAPGVPEELCRAALRRAWLTDPAIRDFVGLAENQWDFTQPDTVPGFGSLKVTPELRRMVARLFGETPERPQPPASAEPDKQIAETSTKLPAAPPEVDVDNAEPQTSNMQLAVRRDNNDAATQTSECGETTTAAGSALRRHGGAMPK